MRMGLDDNLIKVKMYNYSFLFGATNRFINRTVTWNTSNQVNRAVDTSVKLCYVIGRTTWCNLSRLSELVKC